MNFSVFHLSEKLREKGWIVPAYTLPANAEDIAVLRMVVKESFSKDMVEMLLSDIMESIEKLKQSDEERKKILMKRKILPCFTSVILYFLKSLLKPTNCLFYFVNLKYIYLLNFHEIDVLYSVVTQK